MNIFRVWRSQIAFRPQHPDDFFKTDHLKTDLKQRTVRSGAVVASTQLYKQGLSIAFAIIMAQLLGPENTGLFAMVTAVTGLIESFADLGLSAATVQRKEINQRQVSALFWINVVLSLLLGLITAAIAPAIAWFYREPRLTLLTLAIASTFAFEGVMIQHRALLSRQMKFSSLSMLQTIPYTLSILIGISAALAGFGYWSLVIGKIARIPFEISLTWYVCPWRPGRPAPFSEVRSMLAFGSNLTGFRLVSYVARNLDNLLIGRFFGPAQLGLYSKAYSLLMLPLQRVNTPIASVSYPALSRLADSPERYRQTYTKIVTSLCLVTMPLTAFLIGAADWVMYVLLGPEWVDAGRIFAWLGVSGLIEPFSSTALWLFTTQGRSRQQFYWGITSTIIIVASILAGIPWGPVGVAASYGMVGLFVRTPLLFWLAGRTGPVSTKDLYISIAPLAGVCCAILASLYAFRIWAAGTQPLFNLVGAAAISMAVGLCVLLLMPRGRAALQELRTLPKILLHRQSS